MVVGGQAGGGQELRVVIWQEALGMTAAEGSQQMKILGGRVGWRLAVLLLETEVLRRGLIRRRIHVQIRFRRAGRSSAGGRQAGGQIE